MKKAEYSELTKNGMYNEGHVKELIEFIEKETDNLSLNLDYNSIRDLIIHWTNENQKYILYRHYIMCLSLSKIAIETGRSIYDVCKSHERALKRICKKYSNNIYMEG